MEIIIDSDTLKALIRDAVAQAMKEYNEDHRGLCPQSCPCQIRINLLAEQGTRNEASAKSAHHRIDGIFKTAALVAGAVGGVISVVGVIVGIGVNIYMAASKLPIGP